MRTSIMIGIVIGGGLVQLIKFFLGHPPTLIAYFDSVYWAGAALLMHWGADKFKAYD